MPGMPLSDAVPAEILDRQAADRLGRETYLSSLPSTLLNPFGNLFVALRDADHDH